jgi:hypothetical protein
MKAAPSLPGFERLLEVCRGHGVEMYLEPQEHEAPEAGALFAGQPVDPLLAALHARVGRFGLVEGFFLLPLQEEQGWELLGFQERWRRDWPEPFASLFVFAKEQALAYSYAMVPSLANEQGYQPVVRIDTYEELYALPVASSLDSFFDTCSRSLERQVELAHAAVRLREDIGSAPAGSVLATSLAQAPRINFPWEVPELIARDRPLVELLRAGRFDFLMQSCEDARRWVGEVLAARAQAQR